MADGLTSTGLIEVFRRPVEHEATVRGIDVREAWRSLFRRRHAFGVDEDHDYRQEMERRKWQERQRAKYGRNLEEARKIPRRIRDEVLSSGPCVYCGNLFPTNVDHIIPVARGGTRRRRNLAPACHWCNGEKLSFTVEEWRELRLQNGQPWPPERLDVVLARYAETGSFYPPVG